MSATAEPANLAAGGRGITEADVQRIYKLQRGRCAAPHCRKKLGKRYHIDHIIPLAKGGLDDPANAQLLCPTHNHQKNSKDPIDFMQSLGFLL